MRGTVYIVGAGLAGLSAAVRLTAAGRRVVLYEAAPQAGGRCRSFHDKQLDCLIDNGNHLLLSGNHAARSYLHDLGASDAFEEITPATLPFLDLETNERWRVTPGLAWLLNPRRRVPGTSLGDYLRFGLAFAGDRSVAEIIKRRGAAWRRFWQPLTIAALNTQPDEGAARLLWAVVRETFLKGEAACRPLIAREGLGPALIDPALRFLARHGSEVRLGWRLRGVTRRGPQVHQLLFDQGSLDLGPDDRVVLALPPWNLGELLPERHLPFAPRAIVNAHLRLPKALTYPLPLLGLIGGTAEWLFVRGTVVSLTVSAAEAQLEQPRPDLAQRLWADAAKALGLPAEPQPPLRLLIEKRATFAATPAAERHRPRPAALGGNVTLAGDWTATGLPATIEGAIRSGFAAAKSVLSER